MPRLQEVLWVLDHLDDLEADFMALYRIEDMYDLPGPKFFSLALRVAAYGGVMTARVQAEQEKQEARTRRRRGGRGNHGVPEVPQNVPATSIGEYVEVG